MRRYESLNQPGCPTGRTGRKREKKMNEWFCTVFPNDLDEMPQDFESYVEAKERGEVVIEGWGHWYWGRGNTGQGIALDGVISSICYGMEILEGQKYSWENRT